jgi:hypothetical protein
VKGSAEGDHNIIFCIVLLLMWFFPAGGGGLAAVLLTLRQYTTLSSSLMDPIVMHPAVSALDLERRPKKKLKPKHKRLFLSEEEGEGKIPLLINELGVLACDTGVVPRKEFFETYAAAVFIDAKFPRVRRVADLAGGHGLLSWFLLALDPTRSAVVVDRCMPNSADAIAEGMLSRFPDLESQWTYVQADLVSVEAHPSTLLASVHACGTLSDYLVELAIHSGAPLAIVPCCHTVQTEKGYRPHAFSGMDAASVAALVDEQRSNERTITRSIGDVVDEIRCVTLENAGFAVEEVMLPDIFTKRNRLIMSEALSDQRIRLKTNAKLMEPFFERKVSPQSKATPKVIIPLANDRQSVQHCRSIGGRSQASTRLQDSIPKHFSPSLDVSIFLPHNISLSAEKERDLESLANLCCTERNANLDSAFAHVTTVECAFVGRVRDISEDKGTGRKSQSYRITYKTPDETSTKMAVVPKEVAKSIHAVFVRRIESDLELIVR